jgi:YfiH family protein
MISSDLLMDQTGVRHGFFTRQDGASEGIYASLNCGFGSDDVAENVAENRRRVASRLGVAADRLVTVRQVHSPKVITAEASWTPDEAPEGDAAVTTVRGLAIGILTADCTPILFADAEAGVIGAAHAGWRGAKSGIIEAVVHRMEQLGADRKRICAAIGPTISQNAYEVGTEFEEAFCADDNDNRVFFTTKTAGGKPHFDLPAYCREALKRAGLRHIDSLEHCTCENESLFFSYRRSVHRGEGDYGRQISAIVLL